MPDIRRILIFTVAFVLPVLAVALAIAPHTGAAGEKDDRPVLVELFTSEGCSSCPPADQLLAELYASPPEGVELIPLAFHVDYWDYLGWKDPFGSPEFSQRQQAYAMTLKSDRVYTPQVVVNGTDGLVGNRRTELEDALARAARQNPTRLSIEIADPGGTPLVLLIQVPESISATAILWAAVAEDGLSSVVTRGENKGKRLTHPPVVRTFRTRPLGGEGHDAQQISVTVPWSPSWKRDNCTAVAALQDGKTGAIFALGQLSLGSSE